VSHGALLGGYLALVAQPPELLQQHLGVSEQVRDLVSDRVDLPLLCSLIGLKINHKALVVQRVQVTDYTHRHTTR
jgi:hypothetical protein